MERDKKKVLWEHTDAGLRKGIMIFFVALLAWVGAMAGAPFLVNAPYECFKTWGSAIYFFMDPVCHQLPGRSLFVSGLPMPVCARCFAIYLTGTVVVGFAIMRKAFYLWPTHRYVILSLLAGVLIVPEKAGWMADYVTVRMLAGGLLGVLIFRLLLEAVVYGKRKVNE